MIFATVGTQLPFPRLIDTLNGLAKDIDEKIVAQVGTTETDTSASSWRNLDLRPTLTPDEFGTLFQNARVIVAHAGIGTILSAKRWGKPLIILPRRHALGEHRNDHQLATAQQVQSLTGIHVAWEASDLAALLAQPDLACATQDQSPSHAALIGKLRDFILA